MRSSLYLGLVTCLLTATPSLAVECPAPARFNSPSTALAVQKILPAGIDLDAQDAVESAVYALAQAGVPDDVILDNLIASYCTTVAAQSGVPDATKTEKVQTFAVRVEPVVYSDED